MQPFMMRPSGLFSIAIFIMLLWGSPAPLIKLSYQWLNIDNFNKAILFAGYRFLLAAILLFIVLSFIQKKKVFSKPAFQSLIKVGFTQNFLQYSLFYIGISLSTSMIAVIMTGTTSLFQILIAHLWYDDDRLNLRKGIGVLLGFIGILMVSIVGHHGTTGFGLGELLLILSNLSAAVGNLIARKEAKRFDVGIITFYQLFIGSLCLIAVGLIKTSLFPFHFTLTSSLVFLYLAFVSTIGFYLYNLLLSYHPVSSVSIFLFLIPVFGVIYSSLLLSEQLTFVMLIGLIFVSSGIIVVNGVKYEKSMKKREVG